MKAASITDYVVLKSGMIDGSYIKKSLEGNGRILAEVLPWELGGRTKKKRHS